MGKFNINLMFFSVLIAIILQSTIIMKNNINNLETQVCCVNSGGAWINNKCENVIDAPEYFACVSRKTSEN